MNPQDPESAQRIVTAYARVLECADATSLPAPLRTLPYPKQTIKTAILTCRAVLRATDQLDEELREFLEEAYVALADYLDDELVRVMTEYREALELVRDVRSPGERLQNPAWRRVSETSRLAGDVARSIADETAALRTEFRTAV